MIPNSRHLEYASGYLALGLLDEASDELEMIEGDDRMSADVMRLRVDLYHQAKQWDLLLAVARALARLAPEDEQGWISWAFALRELQRVPEAQEVLVKAESIHGQSCATLHYNLACYACLLGNMEDAKNRPSTACKMEAVFKASALDDPDLSAIWDDIAEIE
jgi:lipopolysaccharide biosynthesis regulator YciM